MSPKLKRFLQSWVINTLAVLVAAYVIPGIRYRSAADLLIASLLLGILNSFIRPLLLLLALPVLIFTLGLFVLVINGVLLWFVGSLNRGFQVDGFVPAFWGALIISVISLFLNSLTGSGNARIEVRRDRKPPGPGSGSGGNGPVIDV
jgi:putative membrane protein